MPATTTKAPTKKAVLPATKSSKAAAAAASKSRVPRAVRQRRGAKAAIPTEQRRHYIEVAAYYIAERRGFASGDPMADWSAAEAEIDRLLAEGLLNA